MQELLTEYAMKALEALESGVNWLSGELPLYIEELIKWRFGYILYLIIVGVLLFVGLLLLGIKLCKIYPDTKSMEAEMGTVLGAVFSFIGSLAGGIMILVNIPVLIQISIAPRVYLLEYLTGLVGGGS